jgi:hypothetical protein
VRSRHCELSSPSGVGAWLPFILPGSDAKSGVAYNEKADARSFWV